MTPFIERLATRTDHRTLAVQAAQSFQSAVQGEKREQAARRKSWNSPKVPRLRQAGMLSSSACTRNHVELASSGMHWLRVGVHDQHREHRLQFWVCPSRASEQAGTLPPFGLATAALQPSNCPAR